MSEIDGDIGAVKGQFEGKRDLHLDVSDRKTSEDLHKLLIATSV
jgi:hypothetical protein